MNYKYHQLEEQEQMGITGFHVDEAFYVYDKNNKIGIIAISKIEPRTIYNVPRHDISTIFLEWIEIYRPFRSNGYLKNIFKDIFEKYHVENIMFECNPDLKNMYLHIGSSVMEYETFRDMWTMNISSKTLK